MNIIRSLCSQSGGVRGGGAAGIIFPVSGTLSPFGCRKGGRTSSRRHRPRGAKGRGIWLIWRHRRFQGLLQPSRCATRCAARRPASTPGCTCMPAWRLSPRNASISAATGACCSDFTVSTCHSNKRPGWNPREAAGERPRGAGLAGMASFCCHLRRLAETRQPDGRARCDVCR